MSASFSAGSASAISAGTTQAGGGASIGRGAGAATVAIQRIKAATEPSITRETAEVPTRSMGRPTAAGKAHATSQPQKVSIFDPDVGALACGGDVCLEILQRQRAELLKNAQFVAGVPVVGSNPLGAGPKAGLREVVKRGWLARAWSWVRGLFEAESAAARGALPAARYAARGFAEGQLESHFAKHAAEWGAGNITKAGYLKRAQSLLGRDVGGDILGAVRANGDVLRYNAATNEFAVGAADGTIRTLFRPSDGMAYWLKQVAP